MTLRDETESADRIEVTVVTAIGEEQREVIDLTDIPDRAGLEAIADKEGMSGLRVIADRLGVRAKSIPVLIDKILEKRG